MNFSTSHRLGIIAGTGDLPKTLYTVVPTAFVVGIKGFATPEQWADKYTVHNLANVGAIIKSLKSAHVTHVILAGGIDRPSFNSLIPDIVGVKLLSELRKSDGGDDAVLRIVTQFLEQSGFTVVGVDDILGTQYLKQGVLTAISPTPQQQQDIQKGLHILSIQSSLDIGQAVVIQDKITLAVEAIEGTDNMIKRCEYLKRQAPYGPILIKAIKQTQTRTADLPTVGVSTLKNMYKYGFSGLAISAHGIVMLDKQHMIQTANDLGMFIISV